MFEPLSGESLGLWYQELQDYMDTVDNVSTLVEFFFHFSFDYKLNIFGGRETLLTMLVDGILCPLSN